MSILKIIDFRPAVPEDINFVYDSWIKTWRKSPYSGTTPNNRFHEVTREMIQQLIQRGAKIEIAFNVEDRDQIIGYSMHEMSLVGVPVVHWIHVKGSRRLDGGYAFRQKHIGTTLLERITKGKPFVYTHWTRDGNRLTRKHRAVHLYEKATSKNLEPIRRIEQRP